MNSFVKPEINIAIFDAECVVTDSGGYTEGTTEALPDIKVAGSSSGALVETQSYNNVFMGD